MERNQESTLNVAALLALIVGIFGSFCPFFWGTGGVGAIVLGAAAHGEIKRSEGRQHGSGFAVAGITLGVLHLCALVVLVAVLLVVGRTGAIPTPPVPPAPAMAGPPAKPRPAPSATAPDPDATTTREAATRVTRFGGVALVDPGLDGGGLRKLLRAEQATARNERQTLMLWVSAAECRPCMGVSVALSSPKLQAALDGVRLLRLDAQEYAVELAEVGLAPDVLPGFALLGANGEPTDYVNGGEWDEDIPENIAPVLGNFARGTYKKRRQPWSATPRQGDSLL